jgi:hypothetical protein
MPWRVKCKVTAIRINHIIILKTKSWSDGPGQRKMAEPTIYSRRVGVLEYCA